MVEELFALADEKYKDFQLGLTPTVDPERFIGVRTPALRDLAKKYKNTPQGEAFISELPHFYFDENQLHAFLVSEIKDYDNCISQVKRFLPYVDNWATCDQLRPKCFKKNRDSLLEEVEKWLKSEHIYTVRFGIAMLMCYFLDDAFDKKYLKMVSEVTSDEYYVKMMVAWYYATALAKQYEATIPYIEKHILCDWTHKKTIQKARESFRVTAEQKEYLKSLR